MALENPFPLYGTITDAGNPVNGANVYCIDYTVPGSTVNITTGADGKYIIEMMDIGTDGHDYYVWAFAPDGKYKKDSFELITTDQSQKKDLALENYPLSETVNAASDGIVKNASKAISDTVNAATDSPTKAIGKAIGDTVNAVSEALTKNVGKSIGDTVNAATDTTIKNIGKSLNDTVNAATDANIKDISKPVADTVPAASDTVIKDVSIVESDTATAADNVSTVLSQSFFYLRGYMKNDEYFNITENECNKVLIIT